MNMYIMAVNAPLCSFAYSFSYFPYEQSGSIGLPVVNLTLNNPKPNISSAAQNFFSLLFSSFGSSFELKISYSLFKFSQIYFLKDAPGFFKGNNKTTPA
jgi:hypothetical protein